MDWNGDMLALAQDSRITILSPVPKTAPLAKNLPSQLQQEWVFQVSVVPMKAATQLRFTSKYIVASLESGEIVVINHLDGSQLQLGVSGHASDINSVDVSDSGLVVSCDDDSRVVIWEYGKPVKTAYTNGIPTLVKFWLDKEADKILVVEDGKRVKIYDWRKDTWLATIYPLPDAQNCKPYILDVTILNGNVVVIGDGWWKEYNTTTMQGGAGYTYPTTEESLSGWIADSKYISSNTAPLIGSIGNDRSCYYDLTSRAGQGQQFKLQLPSVSVPAGAINQHGVVAFVSGSKLILSKPFDSYETMQY